MAPYTPIAHEYYDPDRHPTCANFDELSRRFLVSRVRARADKATSIVEVGVGRSVVAPAITEIRARLDGVILIDVSAAMLEHSRRWEKLGARLLVADAQSTGVASGSADLVVASLGDPYNTPAFWGEVRRLLRHDGTCLFTTPASEWADRFRQNTERDSAEFLLANGSVVLVPSYAPRLPDQISMIESANLIVDEVEAYFASDLTGPVSQKLIPPIVGGAVPILRGFSVRRLR